MSKRIDMLEKQICYLQHECTRMASILRHLTGPHINELPSMSYQTKASFDFQWDKLPEGRFNLENEQFRKEAAGYVCEFTQLPKQWFKEKSVVDVGCGAGRYSWAMSTMGAHVMSLDQAEHGLQSVQAACSTFANHRTKKVDLLCPLDIAEKFDLVWCFGVLHHTGDTYRAYKNILPLVKPGGYLFLMLYGEPRTDIPDEFDAVNEYFEWRDKTSHMNFDEKLAAITEAMKERQFIAKGEEYIHGYFDAISPVINDLYSWEEILTWLTQDGFTNVRRTTNNRNHHVIAQKPH